MRSRCEHTHTHTHECKRRVDVCRTVLSSKGKAKVGSGKGKDEGNILMNFFVALFLLCFQVNYVLPEAAGQTLSIHEYMLLSLLQLPKHIGSRQASPINSPT